jgi:vacuolar protein sorting-associated protein 72
MSSKEDRAARTTRGLRMADLVGEAADEDETFWNHGTWAEGSEDDNHSEEELKPDVFDSDFNDTESDSDSDDDSDEENLRKSTAKNKQKESAAVNRYKEPGAIVSKPKPIVDKDSIVSTPKPLKRSNSSMSVGSVDTATSRSVRMSTQVKTEMGDSHRKRLKVESDSKKKLKPKILIERHIYTQKELLIDALETEETNLQWLSGHRFNGDDNKDDNKIIKKSMNTTGQIRKYSRRGTYDTITFTDVDNMPSVFNLPEPEIKPKLRCPITGTTAKYFDPLTQQPYGNLEAFKVLRARYKISADAR